MLKVPVYTEFSCYYTLFYGLNSNWTDPEFLLNYSNIKTPDIQIKRATFEKFSDYNQFKTNKLELRKSA